PTPLIMKLAGTKRTQNAANFMINDTGAPEARTPLERPVPAHPAHVHVHVSPPPMIKEVGSPGEPNPHTNSLIT
ncbi:hypothetical protein, partial [Micromonospora echinospora]